MKHKESEEQQALFQWAKLAESKYSELKLLHHIPNGGKRSLLTAIRLKAEGVKAGVPDICLPVPRNKWHGLYIELKADKNKPTALQNWWIEELSKQGHIAEVCVGWESAKDLIIKYLEG